MTVRTFVLAVVGMSPLFLGAPAPSAQEMTERFIPVGQSPGLSGKATVIGKIQAINARDQTVTIAGPAGTWSAKVTERTKIWLDRSMSRKTNLTGTFSDLRQGLTVEVKPDGSQRGAQSGPAEWIKVQIPPSP